MNNIKITIKKELRSIVRDKKTFITLLAMPLIGMFFVIVYGVMFDQNQVLEPYKVGIDFEPNIIENIVSSEYQLETVKYDNLGEMEKSYKDKDISAYIDYNKEEKKYYFYTDNSQDGYQLQSLIRGYFESLKNNELITYVAGEGIDYEEITAKYNYEFKELEGSDFILVTIYSTLFMLIFAGIISTSQSMAISTTVTEKESGTLETILSFPISQKELILGKYLANFIASAAASIIEFLSVLLTLVISSHYFVSFSNLNISISAKSILIGLCVSLASSLVISALATILVANTKTAKEAGIKLAILQYLSMIPLFTNILSISTDSLIYYAIPIVNCVQILMDIFSNNFNTLNILMTIISTLILSAITVFLIIKKYNQEKVLFGD